MFCLRRLQEAFTFPLATPFFRNRSLDTYIEPRLSQADEKGKLNINKTAPAKIPMIVRLTSNAMAKRNNPANKHRILPIPKRGFVTVIVLYSTYCTSEICY